MPDARRLFGNQGEEMAAEYLRSKGIEVLARQFVSPFGEIDLVCQRADDLIFVEVKTRLTNSYGYPEDSVTEEKMRHLVLSAEYYLDKHHLDQSWRMDVVAIEFDRDPPSIFHFEDIDIPESVW